MLDLKYITNIKIVGKNEGDYLTDKILLQPKFLKLVKINIDKNNNVTNLNRFKKLTEINISGIICGVDDAGICELSSKTNSREAVENLIIINASNNPKITNLNRFKKLTEINIGWNCGVNDSGICELSSWKKSRGAVDNLLIINAHYNKKITNLVRSTA
jgi:hypothetical protein